VFDRVVHRCAIRTGGEPSGGRSTLSRGSICITTIVLALAIPASADAFTIAEVARLGDLADFGGSVLIPVQRFNISNKAPTVGPTGRVAISSVMTSYWIWREASPGRLQILNAVVVSSPV